MQVDAKTYGAAINQNAAMREELALIGNRVSDLARAMRVDQANPDGSWPDTTGRIDKLIAAAAVIAQAFAERDADIARLTAELDAHKNPTCHLCRATCRGHSMGHDDQWEPEEGSRAWWINEARQALGATDAK